MRPLPILAALAALTLAGAAPAQEYPSQPIRIVVPYPAGGAVDFLGRQIASRLGPLMKQNIVIDNRAGAGGLIGSDHVAKSEPNGYTLLLGTNSTHAIAPYVKKTMPYDARADFKPVALLAVTPYVVVVNPTVPARTLSELIALEKAKPGSLTFGSAGTGTTPHLAGELFNTMAGVQMRHIPYKGSAPVITDLLGGQIHVAFDNSAMAHIKAGRLRPLAVTGPDRLPSLPDVPTPAQAGLPGYEALGWFGLYAPAGTPDAIVARLADAAGQVMAMPDLVARITEFGLAPRVVKRGDFHAFLLADQAKWAKVVQDARVVPE